MKTLLTLSLSMVLITPSLAFGDLSPGYHYLVEGTFGQTLHDTVPADSYGFDLEIVFPDHHWAASFFYDYEKGTDSHHKVHHRVFSGLSATYLWSNHLKTILGAGNINQPGHQDTHFLRTGLGYEWHPYHNQNFLIIPTYFVDHYGSTHDHSLVLGIGFII